MTVAVSALLSGTLMVSSTLLNILSYNFSNVLTGISIWHQEQVILADGVSHVVSLARFSNVQIGLFTADVVMRQNWQGDASAGTYTNFNAFAGNGSQGTGVSAVQAVNSVAGASGTATFFLAQ